MEKRAKHFLLKMTKAVIGLTVAVGCFIIMNVSSYAYTQTSGVVIPATAKIRAEANTVSGVIGSTAAGKTVTITDEVTGADGSVWYQVIVDAATKGYIRSDLVNKAGAPAASPSVTPEAATPVAADAALAGTSVTEMEWQSGKVSTKSGRIRKAASTEADPVASAPRGTVVTVTGKTTGTDGREWYQVSFTNNGSKISGFIRADLVTFGELEEESPEPAVTEIEGKKEEKKEDKKEDTTGEASAEQETEEGTTEAVSDNAVEPAVEEEQPQTPPAKSVTVLNAEETPILPTGFKEVAVTLNEQEVRAWNNGDFYIFYGESATGETGYFMYDSTEQTYQRYFMTNVEAGKKAGLSDTTMKIILIVLAVIVVVLLVVVTLLTIKLNDYRSDTDWDDEDEEDEDDYPDDEDEEDEEEEIIERPIPRKVNKPTVTEEPRRRPQSGERRPQTGETPVRRPQAGETLRKRPQTGEAPVRRPQAGEEPKRRPQSGDAQRKRPQTAEAPKNKPRNFLAVDEEEELRTSVKSKRMENKEPVSSDLDPEDEDTFVFINLDGDQIE